MEIRHDATSALPRGLGLSDMTDLPLDWSEQRKRLGLSPAAG